MIYMKSSLDSHLSIGRHDDANAVSIRAMPLAFAGEEGFWMRVREEGLVPPLPAGNQVIEMSFRLNVEEATRLRDHLDQQLRVLKIVKGFNKDTPKGVVADALRDAGLPEEAKKWDCGLSFFQPRDENDDF